MLIGGIRIFRALLGVTKSEVTQGGHYNLPEVFSNI